MVSISILPLTWARAASSDSNTTSVNTLSPLAVIFSYKLSNIEINLSTHKSISPCK